MLALSHLTFACDETARMAEFWSAVLGYDTDEDGTSRVASDPRGDGPKLRFERAPKSPTIELPIHLDINVPDREAELERLLGLGARLVETKSHSIGELSETWTVMRDPEGIGFCVQTPHTPPTHSYIGNVTFSCAEPRTLGEFWRHALGWPEEEIDASFVQALLDAGMDERETTAFYVTRETPQSRPRFLFQRREKSRPASYPLHVDLRADDREREVERLGSLGASALETKTDAERAWTVMRDPDGNPFRVE